MVKEEMNEGSKKIKDEIQVTIPIELEAKVQKLVERVAKDFEVARITRKQVLSYVIEKGMANLGNDDIESMRQSAVTDLDLLEALYRDVKKSGNLPDALRDLILKSHAIGTGPKKKKTTSRIEYSNAIYEEEGER
jgi:hypothetical protein